MSIPYICAACGVIEHDAANGEWILQPDSTYPDYWLCLDCLEEGRESSEATEDEEEEGEWTATW